MSEPKLTWRADGPWIWGSSGSIAIFGIRNAHFRKGVVLANLVLKDCTVTGFYADVDDAMAHALAYWQAFAMKLLSPPTRWRL